MGRKQPLHGRVAPSLGRLGSYMQSRTTGHQALGTCGASSQPIFISANEVLDSWHVRAIRKDRMQ